MTMADRNHDWPPDTLRMRVLGFLLDIIPSQRESLFRPLWNVVFSFYDDATHCGCWRESQAAPERRWRD